MLYDLGICRSSYDSIWLSFRKSNKSGQTVTEQPPPPLQFECALLAYHMEELFRGNEISHAIIDCILCCVRFEPSLLCIFSIKQNVFMCVVAKRRENFHIKKEYSSMPLKGSKHFGNSEVRKLIWNDVNWGDEHPIGKKNLTIITTTNKRRR